MTPMSPDDDDNAGVDALARELLAEATPPAGFVEAVVAGRPRPLRQRERPRLQPLQLLGGALAGAAACAAVFVAGHDDTVVVTRLDASAYAVVADDVEFTISVPEEPMIDNSLIENNVRSRLRSTAAAGLIGALAGAAIVHVVEGQVVVSDGVDAVVVNEGEVRSLLARDKPPAPSPNLSSVPTPARPASGADVGEVVDALIAENARLRQLVVAQDDELRLANDVIDDTEGGAPRPFPRDLSPRLTEPALRDAFVKGFEEAGIDGVVTSVDCAEYPCIVWGEFNFDGSELADTMNATSTFAPYKEDGKWVRSWGIGDGREVFAITLVPPRSEQERDDLFDKRVRFRTEQGEKRWKKEHADDGAPR